MLKRQQTNVECLPQDIVELILERLPVISLLRFKSVSKKWKSTIESRRFQERQLICYQQSRVQNLLCVSIIYNYEDPHQKVVSWSSIGSTIKLTTPHTMICYGTCDGLLCIYCAFAPSVVVNPATRWQQSFPLSNMQQFISDRHDNHDFDYPNPMLGFGKDKIRGIYKPVWLYNSKPFGLDNVTTCEVFDFSTNTWRYVNPASPYPVNDGCDPVYLDGSLHWFANKDTDVLSFDLHTETFQVICKTPFSNERDCLKDNMCILDDRLCVSESNGSIQVIWSLDSSKTWKKLCSIDVREFFFRLSPIIFVSDKNKLLLQGRLSHEYPVIYDIQAQSYDLHRNIRGHHVYYFQSLLSVL